MASPNLRELHRPTVTAAVLNIQRYCGQLVAGTDPHGHAAVLVTSKAPHNQGYLQPTITHSCKGTYSRECLVDCSGGLAASSMMAFREAQLQSYAAEPIRQSIHTSDSRAS
jgi:hypothetical protein